MRLNSYPTILRLLLVNGPTKSSQLTNMLGKAGFGAALTNVQIQNIKRSPEQFMLKMRMLAEEAQIQLSGFMLKLWDEWNATQAYFAFLMKELAHKKHKTHHRRRHHEPLPEDDILSDAFYQKPVNEFEKAFNHLMKIFKELFKKLSSIEKKTASLNNNFNQLEDIYRQNVRDLKKAMILTFQDDFTSRAFDFDNEQLKYLVTNKKMHPLLKEISDLKKLFQAEKVSNPVERRLLIRELNLLAVLLSQKPGRKLLGIETDGVIHHWDELRPMLRMMRTHPFYQATRKRWDEQDEKNSKLYLTHSSQLSQLETRKAELQEKCFQCKTAIAKVHREIRQLHQSPQSITPLPDNVIPMPTMRQGMSRGS